MYTTTVAVLEGLSKEGYTSFSIEHFREELEKAHQLEQKHHEQEFKKWLRPHQQYVKGELTVDLEKVKHMLKSVLLKKIKNSAVTGETVCRKTGKQFSFFDKGKIYISVTWLTEMFVYGGIKKCKQKNQFTLV